MTTHSSFCRSWSSFAFSPSSTMSAASTSASSSSSSSSSSSLAAPAPPGLPSARLAVAVRVFSPRALPPAVLAAFDRRPFGPRLTLPPAMDALSTLGERVWKAAPPFSGGKDVCRSGCAPEATVEVEEGRRRLDAWAAVLPDGRFLDGRALVEGSGGDMAGLGGDDMMAVDDG